MSLIYPHIFRFKGGIHPKPEGKSLSSGVPSRIAPLLERYIVPLHQNIGTPPVLCVKVGDKLKKGQKIAEAEGRVSVPLHSPTSGTVKSLPEIPGVAGNRIPAVEIESDGADEWGEDLAPLPDWRNCSSDELRQRVLDAGIIGMGGAAFPAHIKLSPPPEKIIDTLLLNGAECEPFLSADHRLMLEYAERVLTGAKISAKILHVNRIFIAIEQNKMDAVKVMSAAAADSGIQIIPLPVRYPQGAEKQLIYAVTGRAVTSKGLPMDVGCVVQNVGTSAAICDAVLEGHPLIERLTTITGTPVVNPGTWKLRIGTPLSVALSLAGGVSCQPAKVLIGGPMMGFSQMDLSVAVCKNTSGILLLKGSETSHFEGGPCIRCGRCVDVCPMELLPGSLSVMIENEDFSAAEHHYMMDCMECGACTYVCPAKRPLVQHFRRAKAEINAMRRAAKTAKGN